MISYVIYGSNGSIRRCGRVASLETLAMLHLAGDEQCAGIADADFARVWNNARHYFVFDAAGALKQKLPLTLTANAFTLPADGTSTITISTGVSNAVEIMINGLPQTIRQSAMLAHDTPGDLMIEVSPYDPNYYTDRRVRPSSAAGPGEAAGALVINVEPLNQEKTHG